MIHKVKYINQHDIDEDDAVIKIGLPVEANGWGTNCCGIACIAMCVYRNCRKKPLINGLLYQAMQIGAYSERGWIHRKLLELAELNGLRGKVLMLSGGEDEIKASLISGYVIIASIAHMFPLDGKRGGHLVLINGFTGSAGAVALSIKDPSIWGRKLRSVGYERFSKSFTGYVVLINVG